MFEMKRAASTGPQTTQLGRGPGQTPKRRLNLIVSYIRAFGAVAAIWKSFSSSFLSVANNVRVFVHGGFLREMPSLPSFFSYSDLLPSLIAH